MILMTRSDADVSTDSSWVEHLASQVDWGDAPTWIGLLVAGIVAFVGLRTYVRSVRETRMAQAARVSAWLSDSYFPVVVGAPRVYGDMDDFLPDGWVKRSSVGYRQSHYVRGDPSLTLQNGGADPVRVSLVEVTWTGVINANGSASPWVFAEGALGATPVGDEFREEILHRTEWNPAFDGQVVNLPGYNFLAATPTLNGQATIEYSMKNHLNFVLDSYFFEEDGRSADDLVAVHAEVTRIDIEDGMGRSWRKTSRKILRDTNGSRKLRLGINGALARVMTKRRSAAR